MKLPFEDPASAGDHGTLENSSLNLSQPIQEAAVQKNVLQTFAPWLIFKAEGCCVCALET